MSDHDEDEAPVGTTGLYCFLNSERACGKDCAAYMAEEIAGSDYSSPAGYRHQWAFCRVLVDLHKVSKHLVLMTNIAKAAEARNQPQPQAPVMAPMPTVKL